MNWHDYFLISLGFGLCYSIWAWDRLTSNYMPRLSKWDILAALTVTVGCSLLWPVLIVVVILAAIDDRMHAA